MCFLSTFFDKSSLHKSSGFLVGMISLQGKQKFHAATIYLSHLQQERFILELHKHKFTWRKNHDSKYNIQQPGQFCNTQILHLKH